MKAWRDPVALLAVPAVLYLLLLYALPLAWLLAKSFSGPAGLTLAPYLDFFSDPFNWRVISNTLLVALWVTLVCLLVGYPAAFALARAGAALQIAMLVAIILPLSVGVVVKAFAWQIVLRRDGVVSQLLSPENKPAYVAEIKAKGVDGVNVAQAAVSAEAMRPT